MSCFWPTYFIEIPYTRGGFFPPFLSLSLYYDINRIGRPTAVTSIPIFLGHYRQLLFQSMVSGVWLIFGCLGCFLGLSLGSATYDHFGFSWSCVTEACLMFASVSQLDYDAIKIDIFSGHGEWSLAIMHLSWLLCWSVSRQCYIRHLWIFMVLRDSGLPDVCLGKLARL